MDANKPTPSLARHGLVDVRKELLQRFRGDGVVARAISSVIDEIINDWDAKQPLQTQQFELLDAAVRPSVEALLCGPVDDGKAAAERLIRAWNDVRTKLVWG